jgi:hypothetical protein
MRLEDWKLPEVFEMEVYWAIGLIPKESERSWNLILLMRMAFDLGQDP